MKNRLLAAVAAIALATSGLIGTLAAPASAYANYSSACVGTSPTPPTENNYHWYIYRNGYTTYDYVQSVYTIKTPAACLPGNYGVGQSMAIMGTIENTSVGLDAQCGFGAITGRGDGYWYTQYSNGAWEPFAGNVRHNVGDVVRCKVWATGDGHWDYQVYNDSSNQTSAIVQSPRPGVYGNIVWYGFEINDDGDQLGSQSNQGPYAASIEYPAYMFAGSALWYLTGNVTPAVFCCGVHRSWMNVGMNELGTAGYDDVWAFTASTHP